MKNEQCRPFDDQIGNLIQSFQRTTEKPSCHPYHAAQRILFYDTVNMLIQVDRNLKDKGYSSERCATLTLTLEDIPNIDYWEETLPLIHEHLKKLNLVLLDSNTGDITPLVLLKTIYYHHQRLIICSVLFFTLEIICRLCLALLLRQFFQSITDIQSAQNLKKAYLYANFSGLVWIFGRIARHNGFFEVPQLTAKIKSELSFLVYAKISRMSTFFGDRYQIGKVLNMIIGDLNSIQSKASTILISLAFPFAFIGISIILVVRFSWLGLVIPLVILIYIPIQLLISKASQNLIKRINAQKDKRLKIYTQILEYAKQIRVHNLSVLFSQSITEVRDNEIKIYLILSFLKSLQKSLGNITATVAGFSCFVTIDIFSPYDLSFSKILSTLDLISTFKAIISLFSTGMSFFFELAVIFERFSSILNEETLYMLKREKSKVQLSERRKDVLKGEIIFQNFNVSLPSTRAQTSQRIQILRDITLRIQPGTFVGIIGQVGSGKSTLLKSILKEVLEYTGTIEKNGDVVYFEQEPKIFSFSIRQNILLGKQLDHKKYSQCLTRSCLSEDIESFAQRDLTFVGGKGMTLSGGQKARISLARAIYHDADIYLFDDPFSSVDSKVSKKIYQMAILPLKRHKTVILVTHQTSFMAECDKIIQMEGGTIKNQGNPYLLLKMINKNETGQVQYNNNVEGPSLKLEKNQALFSKKIVSQEHSVDVTWKTYFKYIFYSKISYVAFPLYLVMLVVSQTLIITYTRSLSQFQDKSQNMKFNPKGEDYWRILGCFLIAYFVLSIFKYYTINLILLNVNNCLHQKMVSTLLSLKIEYFDTNSVGSITNKFSTDLSTADSISSVLIDSIEGPFLNLILFTNIFSTNYIYFIPIILNAVAIIILYKVFKKFIIAGRQLELQKKSSILTILIEIFSGLLQIKVYKARSMLSKIFANRLDDLFRANIFYSNVNRVFGAYINYITIIFVWIGWILAISTISFEKTHLQVVSIVFLIQYCQSLQWLLRQFVSAENNLISVQRIYSFISLPKEEMGFSNYDNQQIIGCKDIKIQNLSMKYRPDLPFAIKNISLTVKYGQKIAIVGKTGSGKSSIIQAMLRLYQVDDCSKFYIGGVDCFKIDVSILRKSISIISQSPFLFTGTVRSNIDPLKQKNDDQLWRILNDVNLKQKIEQLPYKLDTEVSNNSPLLSPGERQLLSLARVVVQDRKILILDQATSSVDVCTDEYICSFIQKNFRDKSVISIAHRLTTIASYDKVVVIDKGSIVQEGSVNQLLKGNGIFLEMVKQSGKSSEIHQVAQKNYNEKSF